MSFSDLIREIMKHREGFPTHGTDCVCMDKYIGSLVTEIMSVVPKFQSWNDQTEVERETMSSLRYIMEITSRKL